MLNGKQKKGICDVLQDVFQIITHINVLKSWAQFMTQGTKIAKID